MKKALIFLDVQEDFLGYRLEYIKTLCQRYLDEHANEYSTIIFTHWAYEDVNGCDTLLLSHPDALVVEKTAYSGLNDEVRKRLTEDEIEEIHIAGVHTELSVLATMFACIDAGYETKILEPLVAAYHGLGWDAMRIARVVIGKDNILQVGGGGVYT
jgi:nicotinamidase-related amidase